MCPMFSLPTVLAETLHLYEQIKGSQELLHGSKTFVRFILYAIVSLTESFRWNCNLILLLKSWCHNQSKKDKHKSRQTLNIISIRHNKC